jgi:hypothetical protein
MTNVTEEARACVHVNDGSIQTFQAECLKIIVLIVKGHGPWIQRDDDAIYIGVHVCLRQLAKSEEHPGPKLQKYLRVSSFICSPVPRVPIG